ncbi:thioredoxin fold domain-containing protein [Flammeovirga agarivorans]|uniref:Thioredoxin fold domain-containing protein n=1 Tax=Flammeovirga agarivorans TaxID=2726742 RepID=A0A7X8SPP2_9BACT|nr:thioredoxin fold domain-containing protein [Flammeovirga agarivorans]NLR94095.1 thioredoxin fold domain-containing protein [Flammeovirga agarivorans]
MKLISTLFILLSVSLSTFAQGIQFFEGTWEEAKAEAKKQNKHIFMDAYTTWCGPCKMLKKKIFPQDEVGKFYNETFISVAFDMEKGEGIELAKAFDVKAYPTLLFFSAEGELVHKSVGAPEAAKFIEIGKDAVDPSKQLYALEKKALKENAKQEDLQNYIKAAGQAFTSNDVILNKWLKTLSDDDYKNEEISKLILVSSYDADLNSAIIDVLPKLTIDTDEAYQSMAYNTMRPLIKGEASRKEWEASFDVIRKKVPSHLSEKIISNFNINYYFKAEDYQNASIEIDKAAAALKVKEPLMASNMLNSFAWRYYELGLDTKYIKKALTWVNQSVMIEENYYNLDTQAHICFSLGKYDKALVACEKAIEAGKKKGDDVSGTESLLAKIKKEMK